VATVGFISPRSMRVTVDGETPDTAARSRADIFARLRAVRTSVAASTIRVAYTQHHLSRRGRHFERTNCERSHDVKHLAVVRRSFSVPALSGSVPVRYLQPDMPPATFENAGS